MLFQSTLPVRGATCTMYILCIDKRISIHAPRAGSDRKPKRATGAQDISIHAPRAGSDVGRSDTDVPQKADFNPRSPCGERRKNRGCNRWPCQDFNPRSPCGERRQLVIAFDVHEDFNPRSPCGERPQDKPGQRNNHRFQSTLPVRGATAIYCAFASSKRNIYSISYSKHCERYKRQTSFNRIRCESLWNFLRASDSHS